MENNSDISFLKSKKSFIKKHGHTDSFLLLDPDPEKRYCFASSKVEGFIGYGISINTAIVVGGLIAAPVDRESLLNEFKEFCVSKFKRIVFYNIYEDEAAILKQAGFEVTCVGNDAIIPLDNFDIGGKKKRNLRRTASIAKRHYTVREVSGTKCIDEVYPQLLDIDNEFLGRKATKEMGFFTGNLNLDNLDDKRLFVAESDDGRVEGYIFCYPMYPGNNYRPDLFRKRINSTGVIELILLHIIDQFKKESLELFTLGLSPATSTSADAADDSSRFRAFLLYITKYVSFITQGLPGASGFKTLKEFKDKFRPEWKKCYVASYPKYNFVSVVACLKIWGFFRIRIFFILKVVVSKLFLLVLSGVKIVFGCFKRKSIKSVNISGNDVNIDLSSVVSSQKRFHEYLQALNDKNIDSNLINRAVEAVVEYVKDNPDDLVIISDCLEMAKTNKNVDNGIVQNLINAAMEWINDKNDFNIWLQFVELVKRKGKDVHIRVAIEQFKGNGNKPIEAAIAYLKTRSGDVSMRGICLDLIKTGNFETKIVEAVLDETETWLKNNKNAKIEESFSELKTK